MLKKSLRGNNNRPKLVKVILNMKDMSIRTRGDIISYAVDELFSVRDVPAKVTTDIAAGTVVVITDESQGTVAVYNKSSHSDKTPLLVVERAEKGDVFITVANRGCYINPAYVEKESLDAVIAASGGALRIAK
ncbi:hypothetical protein ACQUO7_005043 [Escherichia coli]|nr:hypothetical protein [Escherichia coli]EFE9462087.1 hypothetical protein [Escherichia coli]EFF3759530.1 hypothetical protein [Escherichia coli]EFF4760462.1 hypothetical protein [Escherichia coli]EFG6792970.1 hypothetical protein [Escherichia coli]